MEFSNQVSDILKVSDTCVIHNPLIINDLKKLNKTPDYEKVIPVSNDKLLQVEAEPFFNAIDRVSTVNQDKTPTVKLQFENNSIKIMATSTDSNKGDEEVAASYAAEALEILFNSKYILDLQDVIEGETMILELLNQSSPVIVKDPKDATSLYILMPMRI